MRHTYGVAIGWERCSVDEVGGKARERERGRGREKRERERRKTEAPGYSRQVMTHCFLQKALTMLSIIAK